MKIIMYVYTINTTLLPLKPLDTLVQVR